MSNSSKSESKPLNGKERSDVFRSALDSLGKGGGYSDTLNSYQYEQPEYVQPAKYMDAQYSDAGAGRTLSGGDYDKLQKSIYEGQTAGLDQAWDKRQGEVNQSMADRGLWASGVAEKAMQDDYAKNWVPAYQQAGAQATQQRYALQNQEQQGLNNYDLQRSINANNFDLQRANNANAYGIANAQARNNWNSDQANQRYQAQWRPADYLAGVWNGTGGAVSSGSASGWSI